MPALKYNPDGTPHIHIWARRSKDIYFCDHPQCFTTRTAKELRGKETVCANCRTEKFLLTREDLRRARPRCEKCSQTAEAQQKRQISETLKGLGIE